jgi:hypothetical protein
LIKAAVVSRVIAATGGVEEEIVHKSSKTFVGSSASVCVEMLEARM